MPIENVYQSISSILQRIESIKRRFGAVRPGSAVVSKTAVQGAANDTNASEKAPGVNLSKISNGAEETGTRFSEELAKESAAINKLGKRKESHKQIEKSAAQYGDIIEAAAKRFGIPEELIRAVIHQESGFDSSAISSKGAMGLMQLMPETARSLGVGNPYNPEENIIGGTRYLVDLLNQYKGNLNLALAAYNAGPNRVEDEVPGITETEDFIDSVLKRYQSYQKFNKGEL
jgi:soluble lytic murein transglycosylase-like protein